MLVFAQNGGDAAGGSGALLLIWVVVLGGFFYFFLIRPQRKRRQSHVQLLDSLEVGDEVQTIGGIIGTLEFLDEKTAVLRMEGGGKMRVTRNALATRVSET